MTGKTGTLPKPTRRRSLSGKLVDLERPVLPWAQPGYVAPPSRAVKAHAVARYLGEGHPLTAEGLPDEEILLGLLEDEQSRRPVTARADRRATVSRRRKGQARFRRDTLRQQIAARLAEPQLSRREGLLAQRVLEEVLGRAAAA